MQDVNLDAHKNPWLSWNPYYKQGGVYVVWGAYGEAYVGLSRNIATRLNQHNEEARNGSHTNYKFQRMYDDANGKLTYSLAWLSKSSWNTGGNYEASLIERYVIKELSNTWFANVINSTKGGEIGGRGYKAVPVQIRHWMTGEVRRFRSITACSSFLNCSDNKIKNAAEYGSYIGSWSVSINDSLYKKRKNIKNKLKESSKTDYFSSEAPPSSIVVIILIIIFIASC